MGKKEGERHQSRTLGEHLTLLRAASGLSLRQVEDATEKEVSNAYLSQLEKDKISKPSPNILHALSRVYHTGYEELMELAGYFASGANSGAEDGRRARAATFALQDLKPEEEKALMEYLALLRRHQKRR